MAQMGSKVAAFLIFINLIFFTCVSSHKVPCPPDVPTPKSPPAPAKPPVKPSVKPAKCPKDTLKLGVCADLLGGFVSLVVGTPANSPCCSLLTGLADLEAALCLCTAIKANVLGVVNLEVPIAVSLLVNACGKKVPDGFKCA
ncbi:Bifunctional inhibitor/plant lipid transfer protein/seed storage helical domain [Macleaya cordata]|uniref:Bifunctional inhibitor/plant lipid transfer protein/seed storage helical domain n=1 Tax=Macleaya cordata TaxID=56857 RepID=A0A200QKP6_MACCD|nr:Bifunctional inhibitor/plant lipid transfer protein/seed storage helical domain [Macleaya cordata]